jgi:hypothetical protein
VITVSTRLPFIGFNSPAIRNPAKTKSASIKVILDSLHALHDNLTLLSLLMKLRRPGAVLPRKTWDDRLCLDEPRTLGETSIRGCVELLLLLADPLLRYNFAGQLARH